MRMGLGGYVVQQFSTGIPMIRLENLPQRRVSFTSDLRRIEFTAESAKWGKGRAEGREG